VYPKTLFFESPSRYLSLKTLEGVQPKGGNKDCYISKSAMGGESAVELWFMSLSEKERTAVLTIVDEPLVRLIKKMVDVSESSDFKGYFSNSRYSIAESQYTVM